MEISEEIVKMREGMNFSEDGRKCPLCGSEVSIREETKSGKETGLYCKNRCGFSVWYGTVGKSDIFGVNLGSKEYITLLKGKSIRNRVGGLLWLVNDSGLGYKKVQFAPRKEPKTL